ncbi:tetracycline-efflux transporter, partial [Xylogone sp. PMI_703]
MRNHGYKRVDGGEDSEEEDVDVTNEGIPLYEQRDSRSHGAGGPGPSPSLPFGTGINSRCRSRAKPSVYRLLPYFFLASLAFGLTMVPRVSVLVTLICRQLVDDDMAAAAAGMSSRRHEMPAGHDMGGSSTGTSSNNATAAGISMGAYDPRCSAPRVTASVAFMSTYRDLITGLLGAVMSYYLGKLSDRIGRVKVLAINGIGILLAELVMVAVLVFPDSLNYRWLFLSFAIDGLSGSFPLLMATASSYVTDSTDDKDRVVAMGWIQSGMFLGMAVGPALGSALSQLSGPDRPSAIFVYTVICRAIGLAFLLILPESLPDVEKDMKAPEMGMHSHGSPFAGLSIKRIFSLHFLTSLLHPGGSPAEARQTRRNLILLMAINTMMFGTAVGAMDVMMLYPQAQFKWDMMQTGNFISIVNIFRTFSTTVLLRLLVRWLTKSPPSGSSITPEQASKGSHLPLVRLSLCADILGYVGFGLAPTGFLFITGGVLSSLSAVGLSTSQASMSMMVCVEHVGNLMGII